MDCQNLKLRFTTWQTYAFLFSILGLLSQHYGWLDFQKELGFYQDIIFALGLFLGWWTTHENPKQNKGDVE